MIEEAVPGPGRLIPCEPRVSFVVPFKECWCPIADHSDMASRLLEHYLNADTPEEEVLGAAILVSDGKEPWNSAWHSEQRIIHTVSWLSGVTALLDGETSVFISTGELSRIQAVRRDNLIILEEQSLSRNLELPPICFDLRRFAHELAEGEPSPFGRYGAG
jgi:hypothetical protein